MRPLLLPLALALLASGCQPATPPDAATPSAGPPAIEIPADPVLAVQQSMTRFLQARSFHAQLQLEGPQPLSAQMDYLAPDRYRITLPGGTQVIAGNVLYLQHNGAVQQVEVPADQLAQWRDPLRLAAGDVPPRVESLGTETRDGTRLHRYRVRHSDADAQGMLYWMDDAGLPRRIEQQGQTHGQPFQVVLTYSRYDDPDIQIEIPR